MPNVEKEFQELMVGCSALLEVDEPIRSSVLEFGKSCYLAAAEPRDALIAQLVGALKDAQEKYQVQHEKLNREYAGGVHIGVLNQRVDAALSAARERGYE